MRSRIGFPLVVLCAVGVIIVAALQGPLIIGEPRLDLVLPHTGPDITQSPVPRDDGNVVPDDSAPVSGLLNPTSILLAGGALVAAALVAAAFLIVRVIRRRRRPDTTTTGTSDLAAVPEDAPRPQSVDAPERIARGIERSLHALDRVPDPQDAIIEAWLGLQESAEHSGITVQPSETPGEFTLRILARDARRSGPLETLLTLYQDVRFGGHRASASDIEHAREALRAVKEVWT